MAQGAGEQGLSLPQAVAALVAAGCVAATEEADELQAAASGNPARLAELVERRSSGEPVAWITGKTIFCGIEIYVDPGVYVPRWQTEPLARRACELLPGGGIAVDLCTGAGAIAVVLRHAVPSARVVATDVDRKAVQCALRNGVEVYEGDLDEPLGTDLSGRVDVITAVTPYVPTGYLHLLPRDVLSYEPIVALDGGPDGTDLMSEVAKKSTRRLRPGGNLLLEIGGTQAEAMCGLLNSLGFEDVELMFDEDRDVRAICARLSTGKGDDLA